MAGTRKTRVPMVEQIRLINECRQSGMTDADWCRENDIAVRKSIDGLCTVIEDQLKMDPSSSALFLFCGRRRDRIKALFREPDGFVLIYKRLSVRGGYQWSRKQSEVRNLSWREFDWLMSGIDIDQPKALKAE